MKVVRDPDVYGQTAQMGVFISLEEMAKVGAFQALDKAVSKRCKDANNKLEYYEGILESGEATSLQQTKKLQWEEIADTTDKFLSELNEAKESYIRLHSKK